MTKMLEFFRLCVENVARILSSGRKGLCTFRTNEIIRLCVEKIVNLPTCEKIRIYMMSVFFIKIVCVFRF